MEEKITLTVKALTALLEAAYNNGCLQRPWLLKPFDTMDDQYDRMDSRHSVIDDCLRCVHNLNNGGDGDCIRCELLKRFMG